MTARELIAWQTRHARRARSAWTSPVALGIGVGALLAAWVASAGSAGAAADCWVVGAIALFVTAFVRVPFLIYWRPDAALLAQLPIEGPALLDAAGYRVLVAAGATTLAALIGATPLAAHSAALFAREAVAAGALGVAAAGLVPAVALYAATIVATSDGRGGAGLRVVTGLASGSPSSAVRIAMTGAPPPGPSALLGALPGTASAAAISALVLQIPWLEGGGSTRSAAIAFAGVAVVSAILAVAARALAPVHMGTILRDVSALDRQLLARLEIHGPTAIERGVARVVASFGAAAALVYRKDARLMRRRYPVAYALGALAFLVLACAGLARAQPWPWLAVPVIAATIYGAALARRLGRPPIELPRLTATLPLARSAIRPAKIAWLAVWWLIFVGAPGAFALWRARA